MSLIYLRENTGRPAMPIEVRMAAVPGRECPWSAQKGGCVGG